MNAAIQLTLLVLVAPLLQGVMRSIRAKLQGRPGPSPLQPYRDVRKLWGKEAVLPAGSSAIVLAAPGILLGVSLAFASRVPPVLAGGPFGVDAVAMALLLALRRFALVLAALATRSGCGDGGQSRDDLCEPDRGAADPALVSVAGSYTPVTGVVAAGALLLVMLAETARMPVDNQETHYELTMIHEGLVLEYGGWQLALLQAAAYIRQAAFFVLAALMLPGGGAATFGWIALFIAVIPLVERTYAKLRLFEVPQLFASATVLALAGIGLRIAGIGAW